MQRRREPAQTCFVQLVPVLVRSDAVAFDPAPYFTADLDGMFVLGGDQTVAMNTVHDTPLEAAMTAAFQSGAVVGGNSAGDAVQSRDMINGYYGANGPAESLRQGAVQVCFDTGPTDCQGGLPFGFPNVITDQHVFEYGRTGRSLNVSVSTGKPVLGMDAATGAVVTDYVHLRDVTGDTLGYVVDPDAYGATASYGGPNHTLRTGDVAMHLLPPGSGFSFDTMTPSQAGTPIAKPSLAGRAYPAFATPTGAGPLFLAGGIVGDPAGLVGDAFTAAAGGSSARDRRARRGLRHERRRADRRQGDRRGARAVGRLGELVRARLADEDRQRHRGHQRRDRDRRDRPRQLARAGAAPGVALVGGRTRPLGRARGRAPGR